VLSDPAATPGDEAGQQRRPEDEQDDLKPAAA
jgi:hypothetical protein